MFGDEDTPLLSTGSLSDASKDMSCGELNHNSSTMSEVNMDLTSSSQGVTVALQCDLLAAPPLLPPSQWGKASGSEGVDARREPK